jgi:hypothetical protein
MTSGFGFFFTDEKKHHPFRVNHLDGCGTPLLSYGPKKSSI